MCFFCVCVCVYTFRRDHFNCFLIPAAEPILPIRRIRQLRRAPETPGGPLALKEDFILVLFFKLGNGYENMNDQLFECGALTLSM